MEIWELILTSGAIVAVITAAANIAVWKLNRKAQLEDNEGRNIERVLASIEEKIDCMKASQELYSHALQVDMKDRITYLGKRYIRAGEISLAERSGLIAMHEAYHSDLGGNGDLDALTIVFSPFCWNT